jgi:hypothetical protein
VNKDTNNIKNYSAEDIRRYWNNQMSAAEMHALEKAAMDDPFLADALEGFSKLQKDPADDLTVLKSKLDARATTAKVVQLKSSGTWWKVAAAIIIIAGLGTVTFMMMNNRGSSPLAKQESSHDSVTPPTFAAPLTSNSDTAQAEPSTSYGITKSDNSAERRGSVVMNHVRKTAKQQDTTLSMDRNLTFEKSEEQKSVAPAALPEKKEGDDKVNLEKSTATSANASQQNKSTLSNAAPTSFYNTFSGKVVDEQNRGVANAAVVMNNTKQGTLTDQNGFFQLQSKDTIADISINSLGYQSVNLKLASSQTGLITLDKSNNDLSEVVVTSKNKSSKKKRETENKNLKVYVMDAEPVVGWDKYNQYLDTNKRIPENTTPQSGEVVLSFKVNQDGDLSSFNVEQSLSKPYDNEAIRLVKEGPAWRVTKGKKTRVKLIVHF